MYRPVNPMAVAAAVQAHGGMARGGMMGHHHPPPQGMQGGGMMGCPPTMMGGGGCPPSMMGGGGCPPSMMGGGGCPPSMMGGGYSATPGMGNDDLMRQLQQAMPGASKEDIMMALQGNPSSFNEALKALVMIMMRRASQQPHAQKLHNSNYFAHGMVPTLLGGLARRFGGQLPRPMGFEQFYASSACQHHAQCMPAPQGTPHSELTQASGRRKALLFASNYTGTRNELGGCVDDQKRMKELLTSCCGFVDIPEAMCCLNDLAGKECYMPTKANIIKGLRWLVSGACPGDVLVIHYSGHGGQQKAAKPGMESDGQDEIIYPLDFESAGVITDDNLFNEVVAPLPEGVKLVVLFDCCHSGSALDLPFNCTSSGTWGQEKISKMPVADVVLISGCRDDQTSADVGFDHDGKKISGGAMTLCFLAAYVQKPVGQTYRELMKNINQTLTTKGMSQRSQLSSSQKFGLERIFDFETIIPNSNH